MAQLTDVETELRKLQALFANGKYEHHARVCELAADIVHNSGKLEAEVKALRGKMDIIDRYCGGEGIIDGDYGDLAIEYGGTGWEKDRIVENVGAMARRVYTKAADLFKRLPKGKVKLVDPATGREYRTEEEFEQYIRDGLATRLPRPPSPDDK